MINQIQNQASAVLCSVNGALRSAQHSVERNQLLAMLSHEVLQSWAAELESVDLVRGQILYESGGQVKHIYFPTSAIVSLMCSTADGSSSEIAVVGNDGAIGIAAFMGEQAMAHEAIVQSEGSAFRMKSRSMKEAFNRSAEVQRLMLRYTQDLIAQIAETAVSNRHFSIEQQLSRRLLMEQDRLASDELKMTQELLGNLLGVRRESVTDAAHKLQSAGLIRYSRGRIIINDRPGLERRCREFYTSTHRGRGAAEPARRIGV